MTEHHDFDTLTAKAEPVFQRAAEAHADAARLGERHRALLAQKADLEKGIRDTARRLALGDEGVTEDALRAKRAELQHVEDLADGVAQAATQARRRTQEAAPPAALEVLLLEALEAEAAEKLDALASAYRDWLEAKLEPLAERGARTSAGRPLADFLRSHAPAPTTAMPARRAERMVERAGTRAPVASEAGRKMLNEALASLDGKDAA